MKCPNCGSMSHTAVIAAKIRELYTFRKYHCSRCSKSFHTHEYLQDTRNEPALKARLKVMKHTIGSAQMKLNEARRLLEQMELSL